MGYGCAGSVDSGPTTPPGDPCAGIVCTDHGTCAVTSANLPICACDQNYHAQALDCVSDADPCDGIDCSLHGTCQVSGDTASCACDLGYHADGLTCVADPVATAPVVTLTANPTTVDGGGTTTLTWSSTDATSCTASGAWSGSKAISGSEVTAAITSTSTFTLACTGPNGSTQRSATIYLTGGELVFFDDFEYAVGRDDANAPTLFAAHGWNGAKTEQAGQDGANGWLYTATSIPGYGGSLPGTSSTSVLVMEARPGSEGFQTDFYLEYGDGENAAYDNAVPGNVWFQFWIYVNHYGTELSQFDEGKFIYACNTAYPCHSHKWMLSLGADSTEPYWESLGAPTDGTVFFNNGVNTIYDNVCTVTNTGADAGNEWKLGQTDTSELITANRWTLVKVHLDTSTTSGTYEAWMRPMGGAWTKVVEWIDGVTPGFTWAVNPAQVGGHRTFRMPSTIGRASDTAPKYDAWFYMDDFAMATSEAALPVYP
ncbi:MAG: hypothetical protein AAB426_08315 [Myxococcota bacterium]